MPLPTLTKTWLYNLNRSTAEDTDLEHRQRLLLSIVQCLLGLGTGWTDSGGVSATPASPWQVVMSSDGITSDNTNRWQDLTDLVWAAEGVDHSWIVLVHPNYFGASSPLYLLLDCSQGGSHRNATLGVYLSRNPFEDEDEDIGTRPTAEDEVEVLPSNGSMSTAPWQGYDSSTAEARTGRLHCWLSSDGTCFRVVICREGTAVAMWDLFRDADWETTQWSFPAAMMVFSRDQDPSEITLGWEWFGVNYGESSQAQHVTRDDVSVGNQFRLQWTVPSVVNGNVTGVPISSFGTSGFSTIQLVAVTPGAGLLSAVPDAWWGTADSSSSQYGEDRSFTQFEYLIFPWNGTVALRA